MPSSTVQTMPGPSGLRASTTTVGGPHPQHTFSHSNSSFSLRNFVAEEDGFGAGMRREVIKSPRSSVCSLCRSPFLQFTLISFTHSQPNPSPPGSSTSLARPAIPTHCRGCFKPTRCPPNCPGCQSCPVRTCCPTIYAIALFEVLCSFNNKYAGLVAQNSPTGSL